MEAKMMLGRYVPADSWIHRLDPRGKLVAMVLYLITVIMADAFAELAVLSGFALLVMMRTAHFLNPLFSGVTAALVHHGLHVPVLYLIRQDRQLAGECGQAQYYDRRRDLRAYAVWRMALLVTFTAILTFTTTPVEAQSRPGARAEAAALRRRIATAVVDDDRHLAALHSDPIRGGRQGDEGAGFARR